MLRSQKKDQYWCIIGTIFSVALNGYRVSPFTRWLSCSGLSFEFNHVSMIPPNSWLNEIWRRQPAVVYIKLIKKLAATVLLYYVVLRPLTLNSPCAYRQSLLTDESYKWNVRLTHTLWHYLRLRFLTCQIIPIICIHITIFHRLRQSVMDSLQLHIWMSWDFAGNIKIIYSLNPQVWVQWKFVRLTEWKNSIRKMTTWLFRLFWSSENFRNVILSEMNSSTGAWNVGFHKLLSISLCNQKLRMKIRLLYIVS